MVVPQYDPPAEYAAWWTEIQDCTGLHSARRVTDFAWIAVPAGAFVLTYQGKKTYPVIGWAAVEKGNVLVLAKYVHNERLVKHEMVHHLMWEHEQPVGHPAEYFDKCEVAS